MCMYQIDLKKLSLTKTSCLVPRLVYKTWTNARNTTFLRTYFHNVLGCKVVHGVTSLLHGTLTDITFISLLYHLNRCKNFVRLALLCKPNKPTVWSLEIFDPRNSPTSIDIKL